MTPISTLWLKGIISLSLALTVTSTAHSEEGKHPRKSWEVSRWTTSFPYPNEDVRTISDAKNFDQAVENLRKRLRVSPEIAEEEFLNRYDRAGHRFLRLMLYLVLFHREARDWVDNTRIGYDKTGSPIITAFEPQWHHIYPRSKLKNAKIPDDEIHALANITVLNERTNVNKLGGKAPSSYIAQFGISEQALRNHLIPESFAGAANDKTRLEQQWSVERYGEFLSDRAKLLAQEANKFLQSLESS